ncbi:unnamed protein product [Boreogadus saida]
MKLAQAPVEPASISLIDAELLALTIARKENPLYALSAARQKILRALAKDASSNVDGGWASIPTESETGLALVELANVVMLRGKLTRSKMGKPRTKRWRDTVRPAANAQTLNHAQLQILFKKNRPKAARLVLDDTHYGVCPIRVGTVTEYFKSKWEASDSFLGLGGKRTASRINNCPPWKLGGAEIHMVGPTEYVWYLGVDINPWKGVRKPDSRTFSLYHSEDVVTAGMARDAISHPGPPP